MPNTAPTEALPPHSEELSLFLGVQPSRITHIIDAYARQAIAADRATSRAGDAAPDGVWVPREPTFEMNKAGQEAVWDFHPEDTIEGNECTARAAYLAMIDAAPQPARVDKRVEAADEYFKIGLLEWAVAGWRSEVANRPLVNIHRARLDDFWRLAIRKAGADPDSVVGPSHAELLADSPLAAAGEQQS